MVKKKRPIISTPKYKGIERRLDYCSCHTAVKVDIRNMKILTYGIISAIGIALTVGIPVFFNVAVDLNNHLAHIVEDIAITKTKATDITKHFDQLDDRLTSINDRLLECERRQMYLKAP